jgi:hypothetical protein
VKHAASAITAALIVLPGCGEDMKSKDYPTATREKVAEQIDGYSSRVFDALQVRATTGANEGRFPRTCPGDKSGEAFAMDHLWQVDDVETSEVGHVVLRVRDYLVDQGWRIDRFDAPPAVPSAVVSATNPKGYVIWVKGITDKNRVAVQVSSPCFRLPQGT